MTDGPNIPKISDLSDDDSQKVIGAGIEFMRTLTEAYGPEKGQVLWTSISEHLGTEMRDAIFMSMLMGVVGSTVRIRGSPYNKVNVIKCIRAATGLGLKEAKDLADAAAYGTTVSVRITNYAERQHFIRELQSEGLTAY